MVELKVEYTEVEVKFGIFSSDPKRFIQKHFCNNLQLFYCSVLYDMNYSASLHSFLVAWFPCHNVCCITQCVLYFNNTYGAL